jgi:Zn-dependent peptidase ImmA (M78 family)
VHEYKAIMATAFMLAHELSHMLYKTEDNTIELYKYQEQIFTEIINLYLIQ